LRLGAAVAPPDIIRTAAVILRTSAVAQQHPQGSASLDPKATQSHRHRHAAVIDEQRSNAATVTQPQIIAPHPPRRRCCAVTTAAADG
jgi:hypothetical protein